jgi:hypothetical protein
LPFSTSEFGTNCYYFLTLLAFFYLRSPALAYPGLSPPARNLGSQSSLLTDFELVGGRGGVRGDLVRVEQHSVTFKPITDGVGYLAQRLPCEWQLRLLFVTALLARTTPQRSAPISPCHAFASALQAWPPNEIN